MIETPVYLCVCMRQKFVSTCLKPTPPESSQLYTWQGCASFVANFMSLEPLDPPAEPVRTAYLTQTCCMLLTCQVGLFVHMCVCVSQPQQQFSSTLVLRCQRATSLEFAALLCSLLLGANYDAYVVCGYADREMCERDLRLKECPLLDAEKRVSLDNKFKFLFWHLR